MSDNEGFLLRMDRVDGGYQFDYLLAKSGKLFGVLDDIDRVKYCNSEVNFREVSNPACLDFHLIWDPVRHTYTVEHKSPDFSPFLSNNVQTIGASYHNESSVEVDIEYRGAHLTIISKRQISRPTIKNCKDFKAKEMYINKFI